MKCGYTNCKSKKTMLLGFPHGLFGHICAECNEAIGIKEAIYHQKGGRREGTRADEVKKRRNVLRSHIIHQRGASTNAQLADYLFEKGYPSTDGTVNNDLKSIGYGRVRNDKGRFVWVKQEAES